MKGHIFRRIYLLYGVVILVAGLVTEIYITSAVRENSIGTLRQNLVDKIELMKKDIGFGRDNLDALAGSLKTGARARVTIIMYDGRVIGDSDHDSSGMANHSDRPEVQQATLLGSGMSIRHSETLNDDFLYVARKITRRGKDEGFIRLAVPLKDVHSSVQFLRLKIILVVLAVLMASWVVALWQTNHLRRLLDQITAFSRAVSHGEIEKRLYLKNAGEFNEIADNLTSMSVRLQGMIRQSEEERGRLNVILRSVPDALLIIDSRGVITLSSVSSRDFFGTVPAAGVHIAEVVRNHEFSDLIENVKKNPSPGTAEFTIESPAEKHLAARVSPLFYEAGRLSGFVAVFHDITGIRKLEQVRKDFVANVSHELKTPITAIRGFADTLLEGALDDRENARRFVQTIRSNSERINALVDDLMTISKIELGVIAVEKSSIDINGVFESIVEIFQSGASAKNLSLRVQTHPDIRQIPADRNRLIQILSNLVDNAVKFTDSGGVTLGAERDGEGDSLFVEDTGMGIPSKFVPRLGERFFRVDPARSRKMGGTGLGLAIVKHLVKAHGWTMKIESAPGRGTKVRIMLS